MFIWVMYTPCEYIYKVAYGNKELGYHGHGQATHRIERIEKEHEIGLVMSQELTKNIHIYVTYADHFSDKKKKKILNLKITIFFLNFLFASLAVFFFLVTLLICVPIGTLNFITIFVFIFV